MDQNDWRLQGQEKYLLGVPLRFKKYSDRKALTDHDHCEFCGSKFSDTIEGSLKEGYTTLNDYWWICKDCYADFKADFKWVIQEATE